MHISAPQRASHNANGASLGKTREGKDTRKECYCWCGTCIPGQMVMVHEEGLISSHREGWTRLMLEIGSKQGCLTRAPGLESHGSRQMEGLSRIAIEKLVDGQVVESGQSKLGRNEDAGGSECQSSSGAMRDINADMDLRASASRKDGRHGSMYYT